MEKDNISTYNLEIDFYFMWKNENFCGHIIRIIVVFEDAAGTSGYFSEAATGSVL